MTSTVESSVLRAGADTAILALHRDSRNAAIADRFAGSLTRLHFRTCYCSALDECWKSDLSHLRTERVKTCPTPTRYVHFPGRPERAAASGTNG